MLLSVHAVKVGKVSRFESWLTPWCLVFVEEWGLLLNHENSSDLDGGGAGDVTSLGVYDK